MSLSLSVFHGSGVGLCVRVVVILLGMTKPIALFDIDNTIYEGFSYFDLLKKHVTEELIEQNVLDDALESMKAYKLGQKDYEATIVELLDIYARGLKGVEYEAVLQSTKDFYKNSSHFFGYVKPVMGSLRRSHDLRLVTGEPQFVAQAVGDIFGISSYSSSEYEVKEGVFTGNVTTYLASRHEKLSSIKHLMEGHSGRGSFAFGDSEGDIEMLRSVEYPICLNPTDGLRAVAEKEGWYLPDLNDVEALVVKLKSSSTSL